MDPTQGWHSIDAQEYPYVFAVCEFIFPAQSSQSFFQKYIDFPAYSNVAGLWWRSVPINFPGVPHLAS